LSSSFDRPGAPFGGDTTLDKHLCQVGGLNQNYSSAAGTLYHIQIEDRGPVVDRVSEKEVRRLNVIVYANYGEPGARIVHGRDHDLEDVRSRGYNEFVSARIQELAHEARAIIEDREQRQVFQIKCLIYGYYRNKSEQTKREFEEANALYPFLFSRARGTRSGRSGPPQARPPPAPHRSCPSRRRWWSRSRRRRPPRSSIPSTPSCASA
jgi:hypothetical protein